MENLIKTIDISNINLDNLKKISNQNDIDTIKCKEQHHESPIYEISENQKIIEIFDYKKSLESQIRELEKEIL